MAQTQGSEQFARLSSAAQELLGLPKGMKVVGPSVFMGMNQTDSRLALDDKELFYVQNLLKIGNGRYRALWDVGQAFFTASNKTIISFFWFNIGFSVYCAVFYSDGTADQVSLGAAVTPITSTANTFYRGSGTPYPACCQSGAQYLLISNNNTQNDYWIWDGTLLYQAGGVGPVIDITDAGEGYRVAPQVNVNGGSGSGIVLSATVQGGSVTAVNVDSPGTGYAPTDAVLINFSGGGSDDGAALQAVLTPTTVASIVVLKGGTGFNSTPAVTVTGGGGSGATAYATLGTGAQAGQVVEITLISEGTGFTGTPVVTISGGGGSGAEAYALLNPTTVASVNVLTGGTNFAAAPALTVIGGGGTGGAVTANMSGGSISSVTVTDAGQGYTTVPGIQVQAGLNNAAAATLTLMPFGVSGYAIEVFTSRVFVGPPPPQGQNANGNAFNVSAPGTIVNFATSDGGLLFTTTDRFLRSTYTNFRQSNGYLYPFGDSSISVISNVQTGGSPVQTTFTYQNTDPQTGTQWRDSCQDFSRTILFANPFGVFGLYGGAVTKVSQKIDRIFENANLPTAAFPTTGQPTYPSAAVANIFNVRCYGVLINITNPISEEDETVVLLWNEREWCVATSKIDWTYIGTREIASDLTAWATDGNSIYQMFAQPSATLEKLIATKLYGVEASMVIKQVVATWMQAVDLSGDGASFNLTLESDYGAWAVTDPDQSFKNWSAYITENAAVQPTSTPQSNAPLLAARGLDVMGSEVGCTISSTSPQFDLYNINMGILEVGSIFG